MSKNTGGPAFPTESEAQTGNSTWRYEGMTLRDYFAAKALQGLISYEGYGVQFGNGISPQELIARRCYELADAMLEAREK